MLIRTPPYYRDFQCLAGACPDTCCAGWEVCIDDDSLARYQAMEGPLGDRVRAALVTDADGDTCFCVENGHCSLQRPDGLCTLQYELGAQALCMVCDAHPRFTEEYGPFRETILGASCPEAARLMLTASDSLPFVEETTDEADVDCDDVDPDLLDALLPCRQRVFDLLRDRKHAVNQRMAAALAYAAAVQDELDMGEISGLDALEFSTPDVEQNAEFRRCSAVSLLKYLSTLEILTPEWRELLKTSTETLETVDITDYHSMQADFAAYMENRAHEYENLSVYFIARRFLAADFDADVYGKVCFAALSLFVLEELGALALRRDGHFTVEDQIALVWLWCKEQEHCDENLDTLGAAAYDEDFLRPDALEFALLSCEQESKQRKLPSASPVSHSAD